MSRGADYEKSWAPAYQEIATKLEPRLRELLQDADLNLHSLNGRIKTRASLEKKLARPDRDYASLGEVTDLLAFRIVTYSEDTIPRVAHLIESAFDVDYSNSVNRLQSDDSRKFGYRSLHYVCAIPPEWRALLPAHIETPRFELQIRTILQHAWAEIEHDLGYKSDAELPGDLRRRFSQIASLLEIADREFVAIRDSLKDYETRLRQTDFQNQVELDLLSLNSVLERAEIREIDREVAAYLDLPLVEETFYPEYLLRVVRAADLARVEELLAALVQERGGLAPFLKAYFEFARKEWNLELRHVQRGYGLLFIAHLRLLRVEDLNIDKVSRLTRFYLEIDAPDDPERARRAARALVAQLPLASRAETPKI